MSRLKVYWPHEPDLVSSEGADESEPAVLPFLAEPAPEPAPRYRDPLTRARTIHRNSRCPYCQRAVVQPIELRDALLNHSRLPIPGTATLVGFHCSQCHAEWPV